MMREVNCIKLPKNLDKKKIGYVIFVSELFKADKEIDG